MLGGSFAALLAPLIFAAPLAAQQAEAERGIEAHAITPLITLLRSHPDGNMLVAKGATGVLLVDALSPELAARSGVRVRPAEDDRPFAAWVFKTQSEPHVGDVSYFRI